MQRVINLKNYGVGRYDDVSPFMITEDLELSFVGMNAVNGEYIAVVDCNGETLQEKTEGSLKIPKDFLSEGQLNVTILYYLRGNKLSEWKVEPLLLQNALLGLSAEPDIEIIKKKLYSAEEKFENFSKRIDESLKSSDKNIKSNTEILKRLTETLKANKKATLKYLYRHYTQDLRDSDLDLPLEKFSHTLGFDISDLSKEELKEIDDFKAKEGIL